MAANKANKGRNAIRKFSFNAEGRLSNKKDTGAVSINVQTSAIATRREDAGLQIYDLILKEGLPSEF